jgi:hypothetical protein
LNTKELCWGVGGTAGGVSASVSTTYASCRRVGTTLAPQQDACQQKKIFFTKTLDWLLVKTKLRKMTTNWKPRSERWTPEERRVKEIEGRNARMFARMLWEDKEKMRQEIEQEIMQKVLAKRQTFE